MNKVSDLVRCFHCGDTCKSHKLDIGEKSFCCTGCRNVYLLLSRHELEDYYCLNETPGISVKDVAPEKFRFLEEKTIADKLLTFCNGSQAHVTLHLPQIHCSSCLWLLEHLEKISPAIISSQVNFAAKELSVAFHIDQLSLRGLAELLTGLGYEPLITLENGQPKNNKDYSSKKAAYKLGITGFCFANIMLISFPEYLGLNEISGGSLVPFFRWINLMLALPVVFYGAGEFFRNAWYSFHQRYVNIDAPIALAISVTFIRSIYEISTGSGSGYLDSMSGIVFFMLLGRTLQNRTYSTLNFNRDYKSYFPLAVTVVRQGIEQVLKIQDIKTDDLLLLRHQEIIPADCMLSRGKAAVDYSFITGESTPEHPEIGDLIYAGGKVAGSAIEVLVVKDFNQNSFTRLWSHKAFKQTESEKHTSTTLISQYFSVAVILIAVSAFVFWQFKAPDLAWDALTAVLIVACPCSLLLTTTFTNGYLLSYFASKGFFLRNAAVIEHLAQADHITFDKTGTITEARQSAVKVAKMQLSAEERRQVLSVTAQSIHPLSQAITNHFRYKPGIFDGAMKELPGKGLEAWVDDKHIKIGSRAFVCGTGTETAPRSEVWVSIDKTVKAHFIFDNHLKPGVADMLGKLSPDYGLSLLSGDNESSYRQMKAVFPQKAALHYRQSPEQKLEHIQNLQDEGHKVIMVGDGLNDAGALQQSNAGITVVSQSFSFSPACEAILEAEKLARLPGFLKQAKKSRKLILAGFLYSILFNIVGLTFAVTAQLSPMVAAILMPSSSLGIILIAYMGVSYITRQTTSSDRPHGER